MMKKTMMKTFKLNPWPLIQSSMMSNLMMMNTNLLKLNKMNTNLIMMIIMMNLMTMKEWLKNIKKESDMLSKMNKKMKSFMKMGMIMFITTELMLFISLFWMILHSSMNPNIEMGSNWPPIKMMKMSPSSMPMTNSILLISSSITITMSHHFMLMNKKSKSKMNLMMTMKLGMIFSMIQYLEYFNKKMMMKFNMNDSNYSSSFFFLTGLHGSHVLIGLIMLTYTKLNLKNLTKKSHTTFELTSWYWHFVDLMWLIVFSLAYWWNQ